MTTTIKVTAHCPSNIEVNFGIKVPGVPDLQELLILQDGESAEKCVYDERQAVIFEQEK